MAVIRKVPLKVSLLILALAAAGALGFNGSAQAQSPCNPAISQCT